MGSNGNGHLDEPLRVVVTGASSGVGRGVAERIVARGGSVALWARREDELAALASELGDSAVAIPCDVSDEAAVQEAARESEERLGLINGLVNAAGIADPKPLAQVDAASWRRMIDINLTGTWYPCRAIGQRLRDEDASGSIVNVGSELSAMGLAGYSAYCATKFGVVGLTKALADELAPKVRVNVLCPGPIDTPMLAGELELADDPARARVEENARPPLGRIAQPGEIADAAVWLLADAHFATGASFPIDGGTTAV